MLLALSPDRANAGARVHLRGVVTLPWDRSSLIVQDRTAGIWVYLTTPETLAKGDTVEIDGHVRQGLFSPVVDADRVQRVGRSPLPKPHIATFRQISTGELDSQYVSITGLVLSTGVSYQRAKPHLISLQIGAKGGVITASFPDRDADEARSLTGALVRITAPVMCMKNQNMQIIAPLLSGDSIREDIRVLRRPPRDLFGEPTIPLNRIMQYRAGTSYWHRVHVQGVVTYFNGGDGLYLENNGEALFIKTDQVNGISPGDWVDVVGFPAPRNFGPILEHGLVRPLGRRTPCVPIQTSIASLSSGTLNNVLVRIEGKLIRRVREPDGYMFLIQDGSSILLAELGFEDNLHKLPELQEGSRVAITGISSLVVEGTWNYGVDTAYSVRPKILLRTPLDIVTVEAPGWWTTRHLVYLSVALACLVMAFLILLINARLREWRSQTMHSEKERLSNEIHDTLAQSFAGIGYHLQAIRKSIPLNMPELREQIDHARELVRYSHKEALRSIAQLESDQLLTCDPAESLLASAKKLVNGNNVTITATTTGKPRTLPPQMTDALTRIGQEAITNAVRHADPTNLSVSLTYKSNSVELVVRDDGCGFVNNGDVLGFGLRGMRSRAAAVSAKLEVRSRPGNGTSVVVNVPIRNPLSIFRYRAGRPAMNGVEQ